MANCKYETVSLDRAFLHFSPVTLSDEIPALYLGFNDQFPAGERIGLLFDIEENPAETQGPALIWEYWSGEWREIAVKDETRHLRVPGILSFIGPADSKLLARFGKERHWLRGRLRQPDTPPGTATINGIFPNATWASQQRTFSDIPLGSSSGTANQIFRLSQTPVLVGERIEVRELAGARANVEWRILAREFASGRETLIRDIEESMTRESPPTDIVKGDLRLRFDRDKKISAVWVRWQQRPHLFFSEPKDRHYVIDRVRGQIFFGDGLRGSHPSRRGRDPGQAVPYRRRPARKRGGENGEPVAGRYNRGTESFQPTTCGRGGEQRNAGVFQRARSQDAAPPGSGHRGGGL